MAVSGVNDPGMEGPRITVATFDPVEQTRIWLSLGAEEATRTMLGALRTALLLADTVVLDRNQIFEGIFFVAMSPDRLAWHLDLPPDAPLPITIGLLNPGANSSTPGAPGPWKTDSGQTWAVSDEDVEDIERNYEAVATDLLRVSSPLIALMGGYGAKTGTGDGVTFQAPAAKWHVSDPSFLPPGLWRGGGKDPVLARQTIDRGRRAWVEALKLGRVAIEPWRQAPINIGPALEARRVRHDSVRALAEEIMRLQEPKGLVRPCTATHAWQDASPPEPCSLRHVTKRSLLVRWLDGETVDELDPPMLPEALRVLSVERRTLGLRWWVGAYYDAICERDDLRMLELHNVVPAADSASGSPELQELEVAWGLRMEPSSRLRTALGRLSRRRPQEGAEIAVEGEIVQNMTSFSPGQFARLHGKGVVDAEEFSTAPTNRDLFDLALAVREVAGDTSSRSERLLIAFVRLVALSVLAVTFAAKDAGFLPDSGLGWALLWMGLAILAAFPWGELSSLLRMSGGELQSTLKLRDGS